MPATQKEPVLVVVQLSGGNDYLNTVIPYNNALYRDNRKAVSIGDNHITQLGKTYGIPSYLAPMKSFWDDGNLAIMHGVGYLDLPRSHFRLHGHLAHLRARQGRHRGWRWAAWCASSIPRRITWSPRSASARCMFRALSVPGVPVACVAGPLEQYGFLPGIQDQQQRLAMLDRFSRMYKPEPGSGVMEYLGTTGLDCSKAPTSKVAPGAADPTCSTRTPRRPEAQGIAQVHFADLGTRVFYCDQASTTRHVGQNPLLREPLDRADSGSRGVHGRPQVP